MIFKGIFNANPEEYILQYGNELIPSKLLPREANECNSYLSSEEILAVNQQPKEFVLTGDVKALDLVDKQKVNLSEYLVPKWLFKN